MRLRGQSIRKVTGKEFHHPTTVREVSKVSWLLYGYDADKISATGFHRVPKSRATRWCGAWIIILLRSNHAKSGDARGVRANKIQ